MHEHNFSKTKSQQTGHKSLVGNVSCFHFGLVNDRRESITRLRALNFFHPALFSNNNKSAQTDCQEHFGVGGIRFPVRLSTPDLSAFGGYSSFHRVEPLHRLQQNHTIIPKETLIPLCRKLCLKSPQQNLL